MSSAQRLEALRLLDRKGTLLDSAREVSRLLEEAGIDAAVIGGVAVVLHGHIRTTVDIDVLVPPPLQSTRKVLEANGFAFDRKKREFRRGPVTVQLVSTANVEASPTDRVSMEGIRTLTLRDLIEMKLRLGMKSLVRAQDLADVIGLARVHRLGTNYAQNLPKDLRVAFRRLVRAIRSAPQ